MLHDTLYLKNNPCESGHCNSALSAIDCFPVRFNGEFNSAAVLI